MRKLIFFIVFVFCVPWLLYAQVNLNDYYRKIEKKILFDKKYLNVYAVSFQPKPEEVGKLANIPRMSGSGTASFVAKDNVTYYFIVLKENFELDSMVLLQVKKIEDKAASSESFFGDASSGPKIDTAVILNFADLSDLYFKGAKEYAALYDAALSRMNQEDPVSMLGLKLSDRAAKSRGITSLDNSDFLLFAKGNSLHRYPKLEDKKAVTGGKRRSGPAEAGSAESDYAVDASLSHITFFHKQMDFGFSSLSAELNTGTRVLNVLPWQAMSVSLGVRSLFAISSSLTAQNYKRDFVVDARLMGRMRLNTSSYIDKIPFVFGDKPKLNIGAGMILDVSGTRTYELPFFNMYFALGSEDISSPFVKSGTPDTSYAYFSFKQWESTMSFYWNTNEDRTLRYRMDAGMGNYNIVEGTYYKSGVTEAKQIYNKIKPVIAFYITFAPQNTDFLGMSFRMYDEKLTLGLWLKIAEFGPDEIFRLETKFITAPFFRTPYPWESLNSSSLVQLRYRYAL